VPPALVPPALVPPALVPPALVPPALVPPETMPSGAGVELHAPEPSPPNAKAAHTVNEIFFILCLLPQDAAHPTLFRLDCQLRLGCPRALSCERISPSAPCAHAFVLMRFWHVTAFGIRL